MKFSINGNLVNFDTDLYATDKRLIAPLTPVLEAMGIPVYSNAGGTVIVASTKKDTLSIMDGGWLMWRVSDDDTDNWGLYESNVKFNGEKQTLPVEPVYKNGQLFVPISSIVKMFGATVEWDEPARVLRISSDIPEKSRMSKEGLNAMITGFTYEEAVAIAEQAGYIYARNAYTIHDYFEYKDGKAYYIFYTIPAGVSEESTDLRYRTTVGSDGSITTIETTYNAENDI